MPKSVIFSSVLYFIFIGLLVLPSDFYYLAKRNIQHESENDNVCEDFHCVNGGRCIVTNDNTPACECPEDFSGYRCQIGYIPECDSLICQNSSFFVNYFILKIEQNQNCILFFKDGLCVRVHGFAQCACRAGFYGKTCEIVG